MCMYLAFFIGMLLPLKWDYSTPVMYPSVKVWMVLCMECLQQIQKRSGCMLISSVEVFMLNAICRLFCNHSWLLACVYAFLSVVHTLCSAWALVDVVIHSCNYIHVHLLQQPYRLFDCLVWDDRKFVTTL